MFTLIRVDSSGPRLRLAWYGLATLLAGFVYFYGLGGDHIPKNGDEFPYAHVTRVTAGSGHLLPLQSEIVSLRNTKPPLLFWQGIASTSWGKNWTLRHLRYPSVIYTLLTAMMVFLLGAKLSGRWETGFRAHLDTAPAVTAEAPERGHLVRFGRPMFIGAREWLSGGQSGQDVRAPGAVSGWKTGCLALLAFLAFFSTYRYGRPFLTDPPDVFWLFLPFFVLLYWEPATFESRFSVPILVGLAIGVGLLYKSFALALPVSLGVAWWYLHRRGYRVATFLTRDAWKIAVMASISLALFALWFVFDPNPRAILKEFILRENVGKFEAPGGSYLSELLWGGSSIWSLALGYPLNAGLLALPVVALFYVTYKRRAQLGEAEKLLWIWVIALFLVFSLPSQRSERYLLPAMPALAVLCALNWDRISRKVFVASLVATGAVVAVIAYLSLRLQQGMAGNSPYSAAYWMLLTGTAAFVLLALFVPKLTRPGLSVAGLLVFLCFAAFLRPFDGPLGHYSNEVQQYARGREVWVPVNFKAKEEGYVFLLPGAKVHPYTYDPRLTAAELSARYSLFAVRLPINDASPAGGKIIGQRLDLGSRHTSRQIMEMLKGKVFEHLFLKELLVQAPATGPGAGQ
jgi:4-amino-4-deoxy-L-arabinose transferase-like glycosyltransferase